MFINIPKRVRKVEDGFVAEIALPGFSKDELEITYDPIERNIRIKGKSNFKDTKDKIVSEDGFYDLIDDIDYNISYHGKGDVEIESELSNGILKIYLKEIIPEDKKPKVIEIK